MKTLLIIIAVILVSSSLSIAEELTLADGTTYHNVTILDKDKTGIKVQLPNGEIYSVGIEKLTPEMRKECRTSPHHGMGAVSGNL